MNRLVKPEELQTLIIKKLEETGLNVTDAKVVADVLIHADMRGVRSHGAIRLEHYCNRINAGGMNLNSKYKFEKTAVAAGVLDADGGMGHVACNIATDLAIEHVQKTGILR